MGRAIIVPGLSITDPDAPMLVAVDQILTNGSLYLMDPTSPIEPWAAGVPVSGSSVPNLAWEECAATLGTGTKESLRGTYSKVTTSADRIKAERSGKGGLHIAPQQTLELSHTTVIGVAVPPSIKTYMKANKGHLYYHSLWRKVTRRNASVVPHPIAIISTSSSFGTSLADCVGNGSGSGSFNPNTQYTNVRPPLNIDGGYELNAISTTASATFNTDSDNNAVPGNAALVITGHRGASSSNEQYSSMVFYRGYLEDLTVSGRSYAEVEALDLELFNKECMTAGGRYYGDTHTAPATLAGA